MPPIHRENLRWCHLQEQLALHHTEHAQNAPAHQSACAKRTRTRRAHHDRVWLQSLLLDRCIDYLLHGILDVVLLQVLLPQKMRVVDQSAVASRATTLNDAAAATEQQHRTSISDMAREREREREKEKEKEKEKESARRPNGSFF